MYTRENRGEDFASLAKLVTEGADEGDAVALQVLEHGAAEVARFIASCAENLGMQDTAYKVAAPVSGLVTGSDYRYFGMIRKALQARHPGADLVKPRFDPVVGAALIALDEVDVAWTDTLLDALQDSWASLQDSR